MSGGRGVTSRGATSRGAGSAGSGARRRPWHLSQGTFESVFNVVYLCLGVNVLLALTNAPLLLALAVVREPVASWPFFLVAALTLAPSLAGAFSCFSAFQETGETYLVRSFWSGYRRSFRRAVAVGAMVVVVVAVLVVDLVVASGTMFAALLTPLFVVLGLLTLVWSVTTLAALVTVPEGGLVQLARVGLYVAARRWYASLAMLALLGLMVAAVSMKPLVGLLVVPGFGLYVVWSNSQLGVRSAIGVAATA